MTERAQNLTVKIDHSEPLEMVSFARALTRLGQRYARFSKAEDVESAQLYITQIREGSTVIDLAPLIATVGPLLGTPAGFNTTVAFVKNMKMIVDYFLGKGDRPKDLSARDCDDVRDIVQPVAIQRDGMLNIQASTGAAVTVNISLSQLESNAVQNRAAREREILKEPKQTEFSREIFYWQVADRNKAASEGTTPDRGIIESIDAKAHKVFFADPSLKQQLITGANPFETAYLVDGETRIVREKLQGYLITAVHESFALEGD